MYLTEKERQLNSNLRYEAKSTVDKIGESIYRIWDNKKNDFVGSNYTAWESANSRCNTLNNSAQ